MRKRKEKESGMTLSQAQQGLCPAHVDVHSGQTEVLIWVPCTAFIQYLFQKIHKRMFFMEPKITWKINEFPLHKNACECNKTHSRVQQCRVISVAGWSSDNKDRLVETKLAGSFFPKLKLSMDVIIFDKNSFSGLPWWSNGWDSALPMQVAQVWPLVGELDPTCCNSRVCMLQLRPGTDKWINKNKYFLKKNNF